MVGSIAGEGLCKVRITVIFQSWPEHVFIDLLIYFFRIHGSYEALDGGNLSDALVDFTGGVSELISLESDSGVKLFDEDNKRSDLFHLLSGQISQHALVCCAIRAARGEELQRTEWGLVKGHAYGVTGVRRVSLSESGLSGIQKCQDSDSSMLHAIRFGK